MKSVAGIDERLASTEVPARSYALREYQMPAKVFHWLTVALVLFMVTSGVIAKQLGGGAIADTLFGLHKLTGALTLLVIVLRLGYRLFRSLPQRNDQPRTRPFLHWSLYVVIVLVPLLGWAGISDFGAREVFGGIVLPPIWPERAGYDELLLQWHAYFAFGLLALVALHVGIAMQDYMTAARSARSDE